MSNTTAQIKYRMDIVRTLEAMDVNTTVSVKIAGEGRDCAISSLYTTKDRIQDKTGKQYQISTYDNGTIADVTRIH